jgi:hypothetical protein
VTLVDHKPKGSRTLFALMSGVFRLRSGYLRSGLVTSSLRMLSFPAGYVSVACQLVTSTEGPRKQSSIWVLNFYKLKLNYLFTSNIRVQQDVVTVVLSNIRRIRDCAHISANSAQVQSTESVVYHDGEISCVCCVINSNLKINRAPAIHPTRFVGRVERLAQHWRDGAIDGNARFTFVFSANPISSSVHQRSQAFGVHFESYLPESGANSEREKDPKK